MDRKLQDRFDALREEEAAQADGYATFVSRESVRRQEARGPMGWIAAIPIAAAAAFALWWSASLQPPAGPVVEPPAFTPGQWAMPTDILLDATELDAFEAPLPFEGFGREAIATTPWRNSG